MWFHKRYNIAMQRIQQRKINTFINIKNKKQKDKKAVTFFMKTKFHSFDTIREKPQCYNDGVMTLKLNIYYHIREL